MADTHDSMTSPVIEKVDYLSRLPPELLDDIFDLAYTINHPPTGPLSKSLLSWYELGLYRRIKLSKDTNAVKLAMKINKEAEKGKLVSSLSLAGVQSADYWAKAVKVGDIGNFVRNLTNLEFLDLGCDALQLLKIRPICRLGSPGYSIPADLVLPFFSNLTYLRSSAPQGDSDFPFRIFTRIPSLVTLDIIDYKFAHNPETSTSFRNQPLLPHLTSLSIKGEISTDSCIATLCSMSPNLLGLRLEASVPDFDLLLLQLPVSLTELDIRLHVDSLTPTDECDELLPRFSQLKHLSIGEGLFSPDLPIYVADLSSLESLELGRGYIPFEELIYLVTGPTRLKHLRRLKLDLYETSALPYRFTLTADGINATADPLHGKSFVTFGTNSSSDLNHYGGEAEKGKELIEVAQREGIEVTGSIHRALQVFDARLLDLANTAVYDSWKLKSLEPIKRLLEDSDECGRLPAFDLDNLDPTKLKLVKTELPEENWFSWTLENEESETE